MKVMRQMGAEVLSGVDITALLAKLEKIGDKPAATPEKKYRPRGFPL